MSAGLAHLAPDQAQLVLATGKRGYGKTFFLRDWVNRFESRVLCFDLFRDYAGMLESDSVRAALVDLHYWGACRRRVRPPLMGARAWAQAAFGEILEGRLRDCLIVLNEIGRLSRPQSTEELDALVLQGRRLGLRIAADCQRVALVPSVILSEATTLVSFRVTRKLDLETLAEWSDETLSSVQAVVPSLAIGECVALDL